MTINANKEPIAFYDTTINSIIPDDAIDITEEQWQEFIDNTNQKVWDDVNNEVVDKPFSLESYRASKLSEIEQSFSNSLANGYECFNGIKMQALLADIQTFDGGVRLSENLAQTNMMVRDFNNKNHQVSVADAKTMVNELGANYQKLLQNYWAKKDAAVSAATKEELDGV